MRLFAKRKEEEKSCCCKADCGTKTMEQAGKVIASSSIKVLGSGCAKCNALEEAVKQALVELLIDEEIEHVTDFGQIAAYGVMTTPALVIDGKVVSYGKVLKKDEVIAILKKVRG